MTRNDGWVGRWRVALYLDDYTNPLKVTLAVDDGTGPRTITEIHPGPFDPAEEVMTLVLEMIEHYGYQQSLNAAGRPAS